VVEGGGFGERSSADGRQREGDGEAVGRQGSGWESRG